MGKNSGIEWTDHTINLWWGCVEVGQGCENCYARLLSNRFDNEVWGVNAPRKIIPTAFDNLLKLQRSAKKRGVVERVFMQSMSDILEILPTSHPQKEELQNLRSWLFLEIVPFCQNLEFLFLTKRIGNASKCFPTEWLGDKFPSNVRVGISVVNQEEASRDIPKLIALPCKNFLSCEPLLEKIDLFEFREKIHWVIVGGESGNNGARPMLPIWVYQISSFCMDWEIPFFFKQWGEWFPRSQSFYYPDLVLPKSDNIVENKNTLIFGDYWDDTISDEEIVIMHRIGKRLSGNLLDGEVYQEFPK